MAHIKTMADLARLAGVSPSTVSRALSKHPSIPEKTRERISALAARHAYHPNIPARNLRLQRSNTVAAVFPQSQRSGRRMSDPFYLEIMGAISDELSVHGYDLLVSLTRGEETYQRYVLDKRADGLLILERDTEEKGVRQVQAAGVPFVVWGPSLPGQSYVSVGGDSFSGAQQAVAHLLRTGHTTIGFVGGDPTMIETQQRYLGFAQALQAGNQRLDARLVAYTDYTPQEAKVAVRRMVQDVPSLDAVFFCSDFMAVAAFETLRQAGKRIPEDVAVIGYDDIPLAAHCHPKLTTVRQEVYEGGRGLVKKLLLLLAGEQPDSEMLDVSLRLRDSG